MTRDFPASCFMKITGGFGTGTDISMMPGEIRQRYRKSGEDCQRKADVTIMVMIRLEGLQRWKKTEICSEVMRMILLGTVLERRISDGICKMFTHMIL